jgi:3-keto-disaccharide hydrolase
MIKLSRRDTLLAGSMLAGELALRQTSPAAAAPQELHFDFTKALDGWETVAGSWQIEDVADAAERGRALVQRATNNAFNVIVAPGGPYRDIDVSVRFKPISGREDASGGIVFRFADGHYYVIRANALEDNFNFYYYEPNSLLAAVLGGRHSITGVSVKAPALGQWHRLRIVAQGDRIQGWLDEQRLIDRRDSRYGGGRVGLWTKADSVTAFDNLVVRVLQA